jgi:AhpD family alkylhydroperoxidase
MKRFRRRIYPTFGAFWRDLKGLFSDRKKIRELMRDDLISPCFRERIMLAVTSVNKCRYCAHGHSRQALTQGILLQEVRELCQGIFDQCPEDEFPALLYAQHWADCRGNIDQETRERIISIYGPQRAQAIEMAIRMIQMGNLLE